MLNPIAIKILVKLMKTEKGIKYSEIEGGMEVEDDLFNYHLQNLCKKGLVEKSV
jgi:predicted transcriptional regulator